MVGFLPSLPKASPTVGVSGLLTRRSTLAPPRTLPLAVEEIDSAETFEAISTPASDLVANGRIAKFLIDRRQPAAPVIRFVNGNFTDSSGEVPDEAKFHYFFGRVAFNVAESLSEFNQVTYFVQDKRYIAARCTPTSWTGRPTRSTACSSIPRTSPRADGARGGPDRGRARSPFPDARLAFVPSGTQQTVATVTDDLTALGVEIVPLDRILGSIVYMPLNVGEAWGHLRIFPPTTTSCADGHPDLRRAPAGPVRGRRHDDQGGPGHELPREPEIQGTRHPQRRVTRRGPDHPRLAPFADQPVHLVVGRDDFSSSRRPMRSSPKKLAEKLDRPLTELVWEPETELRSYAKWPRGPRAGAGIRRALRRQSGQPRLPHPPRRAGHGG